MANRFCYISLSNIDAGSPGVPMPSSTTPRTYTLGIGIKIIEAGERP
jgi:hypothetical protein